MVTPLLLQYLHLDDPGIYPQAALARLIKRCGSLAGLERADDILFAEVGIDPDGRQQILDRLHDSATSSPDRTRRITQWLSGGQRYLLCFEDTCYPPLLRELDCPPPLLYVQGNPELLGAHQLAMVGSRKATGAGHQVAYWLASELAGVGMAVTSGMAAGIDAQAHRGALDAGGTTLAVVGTGLDLVYPPGHRNLANRIVEQGAILSEFPLGTPPRPANFPQRNRIIAGLSAGVIVIEAAPRSGSLITARLAMEANREVFAVPGSIYNANARGCHDLIRQGAKLVDSLESILEELAVPVPAARRESQTVDSPVRRQPAPNPGTAHRLVADAATVALSRPTAPEEERLLDVLGFDPCSADALAQRSGMAIAQVNRLLQTLELKGLVVAAGGRFQRPVTDSPR